MWRMNLCNYFEYVSDKNAIGSSPKQKNLRIYWGESMRNADKHKTDTSSITAKKKSEDIRLLKSDGHFIYDQELY